MKKLVSILSVLALAAVASAQVLIPWKNLSAIPSPTLTLGGDASGSVTFLAGGGATLNLTLLSTAVTAGTYRSVTVDAKGRVTGGTNPLTLTAEGITNGAALDAVGAVATTGVRVRTGANTETARTLTAGTGISIANADGVSGNPTITASAVPNSALGNSTVTLGSTSVALGGTATTIAGLTLTSPTLTTPALGIPASGVVTNLTGTASININGTVGATTPNTVAATTINASGQTAVGVTTTTPSGSTPYLYANGLRLSGGDTFATIYNANRAISIFNDSGSVIINSDGTTSISSTAKVSTIQNLSSSSGPVLVSGLRIDGDDAPNTIYNGSSAIGISNSSGSLSLSASGALTVTGNATFSGSSDSTLPTSGGVTLNGGLGVAKNINSGQKIAAAQDLVIGSTTTGSSVTSALSSRDVRGGLALDGASGSTASATITSQNAGTGDYTVVSVVKFGATAAVDQYVWTQPGFALRAASSQLVISKPGTGYVSAVSASTVPIGRPVLIAYTRSGTTGTYYINGVASGTCTDSFDYTSTSANVASGLTVGSVIYSVSYYNCALSQSDITEVMELGGAVPERFKFGSQIGQAAGDSSDFTGGVGNWIQWNGTTLTNPSGTLNVAIGSAGLRGAALPVTTALGRVYRVKLDVTAVSAVTSMRVALNSNFSAYSDFAVSAGQTYTVELTAGSYAATGSNRLTIEAATVGSFTVDNITVKQIGAVIHYDADADGIGFQLHDQSTNKLDAILTTTGVSWTKPKRTGYVRATTSTNGNEQLGGASLLGSGLRINWWSATTAGTPVVSLGAASAGTQYASGVSLAATLNDVALTTRVPGTNNLWCNSNSTSPILHVLGIERTD